MPADQAYIWEWAHEVARELTPPNGPCPTPAQIVDQMYKKFGDGRTTFLFPSQRSVEELQAVAAMPREQQVQYWQVAFPAILQEMQKLQEMQLQQAQQHQQGQYQHAQHQHPQQHQPLYQQEQHQPLYQHQHPQQHQPLYQQEQHASTPSQEDHQARHQHRLSQRDRRRAAYAAHGRVFSQREAQEVTWYN